MVSNPTQTPPSNNDQAVADSDKGNWVDAYAPHALRPYLRLARADRPIGVWLLVLPCWWSVTLAAISIGADGPSVLALIPYLLLFFAGAFVMRGAGCAYNDFVDRDFDAQVERTKSRPIPAGQVTPSQALAFTGLLCAIGLIVLLQFNSFTVMLGAASLLLVALYPFTKRFTHWPQLILGMAFNWGALVGWTSLTGSLDIAPVILYAGAILWTIGYDTIYAHQDKEDDLMLGLKSTAIRFGPHTKKWLTGFYGGTILLWTLAAYLCGAHLITFVALAFVCLHFTWQISTLDIDDADNCLLRFRSNRDAGAVFFVGLLADIAVNWLIRSP